MGVIIFNGIPSTDINLTVEHIPNYEIPERLYDVKEIPGRGNILIDKKSYADVSRSYDIVVEDIHNRDATFGSLSSKLARWLNSGSKYLRLEDSYLPEYYHKAYCSNQFEVENLLNKVGRATIEFTRKPQRYLKIGEEPIDIIGESHKNLVSNEGEPKVLGYSTKSTALYKMDSSVKPDTVYTLSFDLENPDGLLVTCTICNDGFTKWSNKSFVTKSETGIFKVKKTILASELEIGNNIAFYYVGTSSNLTSAVVKNVMLLEGDYTEIDLPEKIDGVSTIGYSILYNPTDFESDPIIKIYGTGKGYVSVGTDYTIEVKENPNGVIIVDSVIRECYKEGINQNGYINLPNGFPKLRNGENLISYNGAISKIEVIPNWWTL